ncbi:MAG: mechanosensitive ion channel family protein [Candidatus Sedimenticola sp. 4PFRAG1]
MDNLQDVISGVFLTLSPVDMALVIVNGLLLVFSRPIVSRFSHAEGEGSAQSKRLHIFRAINLLMLLFVVFINLRHLADHSWATKGIIALLVIYLGYLFFHISDYLIKKRFGREREMNGTVSIAETYNSRLLSLISAVFIFTVCLISIVRILGFDSLLEAGGVIGFIGVFLALTQGSWAPDIISGLIILNSRLVEEGDVVEFNDGSKVIGVVFKTKVFHTEILNLVNNHRIMLQNSRLRQQTLHNLSKFASAKGLRERLQFKIGYDVPETKVRELFDAAFSIAAEDADIAVEPHPQVEVLAADAGDYAVLWSVYYYTKDVRHMLRTRQLFLGLILAQSAEMDVSLATPVLQHVDGAGVAPVL